MDVLAHRFTFLISGIGREFASGRLVVLFSLDSATELAVSSRGRVTARSHQADHTVERTRRRVLGRLHHGHVLRVLGVCTAPAI